MKRKLLPENYRLRVTAGPSYDTSTHLPVAVNTSTPLVITTRLFPPPPNPVLLLRYLPFLTSHQQTQPQSSTCDFNPSVHQPPPPCPPPTLTSITPHTRPTCTPSSSPSRRAPEPPSPATPSSLATTSPTPSAKACRRASASCGRLRNGWTRGCKATCTQRSRGFMAAFYRA